MIRAYYTVHTVIPDYTLYWIKQHYSELYRIISNYTIM